MIGVGIEGKTTVANSAFVTADISLKVDCWANILIKKKLTHRTWMDVG